ncbi:MAG: 4-(cytidine 5'-diphospho)-2-C-methyl-D-erythritol kinase [Epsilonproteobacteria bacterium]|nr:4-(cytidine 5'-diphospho)-2-C-methyl-D-erythritol kinase [Campylobacterota bacterium]
MNTPAKLNLLLKIKGKSGDFHNLHSLVCFVNIFDEIDILPTESNEITVKSELGLKKDDLVYRAAYALQKFYGYNGGAKINVKKSIPVGAGLGGASSDASASIRALNKLWKLNLPKHDLVKVALTCGSDLPLFFEDSTLILMGGRGEITKSLNLFSMLYFVIVYPGIQVSTKSAYNWYDRLTTGKTATIKHLPAVIDFNALSRIIQNDLQQPVAFMVEPVRKAIKVLSAAAGGNPVFMTGSGSSVVGMFENKKKMEECFKNLKMEAGWNCFTAHSIKLLEKFC